jgi:phospholipid/cholesterol/gamma-HCH transport system substrate-binding protein
MKANYFKFGVFLVAAVTLLVAAIVILGAGMFTPPGEYFETYFDTPVTGLSPGASVELQGVKIGQVQGIGFAGEVYEIPPRLAATLGQTRLVRVTFSVDRRFTEEVTPAERQARRRGEIHRGLRVQLQSNLITGKSFLQGTYVDPNRFPVPEWPWTPEFPFVPSVPSRFATLAESVDRILAKVEGLDVQGLFQHADDLILTAGRTVQDANVPGLAQEVRSLFAEARVTITRLQGLLARPDRNEELTSIAMLLDQLSTTLRRVDLLVTTQTPRLEATLENFRKTSADLKELSESLKRTPSDLLFSAPPRKSELVK